ncbi:hypothetical protein T458_05400 [Brevibacillus panacihumi W25]|uniref:Uncharacterized protein n=1 Tax=Brevibacillus panacihumi W25 TaxID=1408254 RepID=V6MB47_9BACL|nr:hypothetical protein [Brevibacillus panacihumi]EST55764.1 hypothetical protein T458_05400 [Brevibacillus panacihumi W25]
MMLRKALISTLTLGLVFCSFIPSFAAESQTNKNSPQTIDKLAIYKKWGPFLVRPTDIGDHDEVSIHLYEDGYISLHLFQQGIHRGEQASTIWKLYDTYGDIVWSKTIGEVNTMTIFNLGYREQGRYKLTWQSRTNNDTEGGFYVEIPVGEVSQ